jgi:hypothetical protein
MSQKFSGPKIYESKFTKDEFKRFFNSDFTKILTYEKKKKKKKKKNKQTNKVDSHPKDTSFNPRMTCSSFVKEKIITLVYAPQNKHITINPLMVREREKEEMKRHGL